MATTTTTTTTATGSSRDDDGDHHLDTDALRSRTVPDSLPSPSGSPSRSNSKAMLDDTENYFDYAVSRPLGTRLQYPKELQLDRWMEILRPFQTHMELDKYRCRKSYQASSKAAVRNIARLLALCVGDIPKSCTLEDVITENWDKLSSRSELDRFFHSIERRGYAIETMRKCTQHVIFFLKYMAVEFEEVACTKKLTLRIEHVIRKHEMYKAFVKDQRKTRQKNTAIMPDSLRNAHGDVILTDIGLARAATSAAIQSMLPDVRLLLMKDYRGLCQEALLHINHLVVVLIQMSSIPMRSHERVTMDVQAVDSMLAADGIYWTDQAKDSHNKGRVKATGHDDLSRQWLRFYRDCIRPAMFHYWPEAKQQANDTFFVTSRGAMTSLYDATRAFFRRWLPGYHVSPQTLRRLHSTLIDRELADQNERKLMFRAAGHTEKTAIEHYIIGKMRRDAKQSVDVFVRNVQPHMIDVQLMSSTLELLSQNYINNM